MDEQKMPRRPRRAAEDTPKNESLVYGKNPVTELLKSGSGVDTVLLAEGMAPAVAAYFTAMAKEAGATVKRVHPNKLRLMTGTESSPLVILSVYFFRQKFSTFESIYTL